MKKDLVIVLLLAILLSCNKEKKQAPQARYPRPWKTEFISFQNISQLCGTHSSGYKLFYKDTMIRTECRDMAGISLGNPLAINDSVMFFFKPTDALATVLHTTNGGYTWTETFAGCWNFTKFHVVKPTLVYCVTSDLPNRCVTGIGKSNLQAHQTNVSKGRLRIPDPGAGITEMDSTVIPVNDSLNFVILF